MMSASVSVHHSTQRGISLSACLKGVLHHHPWCFPCVWSHFCVLWDTELKWVSLSYRCCLSKDTWRPACFADKFDLHVWMARWPCWRLNQEFLLKVIFCQSFELAYIGARHPDPTMTCNARRKISSSWLLLWGVLRSWSPRASQYTFLMPYFWLKSHHSYPARWSTWTDWR